MPLRGSAFLAIWHDIEAHGEVEYDDWHTREHMPERVEIPGFEAGRRWVDRSLDHLLAARGGLARRCGASGARAVLRFDAHGVCVISRLRNC